MIETTKHLKLTIAYERERERKKEREFELRELRGLEGERSAHKETLLEIL
jgi:hypothetical protein